MTSSIKRATGLVGYAVVPNAREVLSVLYTKTLTALQQLPKDALYRKYTEQIVQQKLQTVQAETDIPSLERKIGCGQAEELIDQAERELALVQKMEQWRPWEPLVAPSPPNQWKWP